jgi:hypothetical protein
MFHPLLPNVSELKDLDLENKINNVKSDINKNKDTLSALEDHKKFLLALSEI